MWGDAACGMCIAHMAGRHTALPPRQASPLPFLLPPPRYSLMIPSLQPVLPAWRWLALANRCMKAPWTPAV